MNVEDFEHFVCIVAGDDPEKLMEEYDSTKGGDKIKVIMPFSEAHKMREKYITFYQAMLKKEDISEKEKMVLETQLEEIKNSDDTEFFLKITKKYEHDEKTGDAITHENPNGKFSVHNVGKFFSVPFAIKDGGESYEAQKKDIDWDKMHLNNQEVYRIVWEMVMEGKEPTNEYEQNLYENMKNREGYFMKYGDKENYVISNTAFWGFAFLSDMTGWQELEPEMDQFIWVKNYYNTFIKNLPEDTLLTIYECRK